MATNRFSGTLPKSFLHEVQKESLPRRKILRGRIGGFSPIARTTEDRAGLFLNRGKRRQANVFPVEHNLISARQIVPSELGKWKSPPLRRRPEH